MENQREAYRKYLEDEGIVDMLTRALVDLYEASDDSQDPLEHIKMALNAQHGADIESLREENKALEEKVKELRARLEELKAI